MTEKLGWVAGAPDDGFQGVILSIQWLKRDHSWKFGSGMVENPPKQFSEDRSDASRSHGQEDPRYRHRQ